MFKKVLISAVVGTVTLVALDRELRADGCTPTTCENAPAWHEGTKYKKGDRVLSARGNMWQCKKTSAPCGGADYEPDMDPNAIQAWEFVQACFSVDTPEITVTDVVVSSAQCSGSVTLTLRAVVGNDSPFFGYIDVAFYHSTSKVLIGVARDVPVSTSDADPPYVLVDMVWNNPTPGSALITAVADDDGTGHGRYPEANELDNGLSTTLTTCPAP
jgi:hypothetical protein